MGTKTVLMFHIVALCWWWSPWGLVWRLADSRIGDYWEIIVRRAQRNFDGV